MRQWIGRNAPPIIIVLVASSVVIGAWEVLDAVTSSEPIEAPESSTALNPGGLVKVTLFLLIPGLVTLAVRRRSGET